MTDDRECRRVDITLTPCHNLPQKVEQKVERGKNKKMPSALVREVMASREDGGRLLAYGALPDLDSLMNDEYDDEPIEITCTPRRLKQLGHSFVLLALVTLTFVALYMSGDSLRTTFEPYSSYILSSLDTESVPTSSTAASFTVTSPAFDADGTLPDAYTCKLGTETGVSPPLAWSGAPDGTVDYMLTMKKESGYSWTLYDLGTLDHVDAAVSNAAGPGATVGQAAGTEAWDIDVPPYISTANYVSMYKYEEPCSKGPGSKWYLFTVYAFSRKVTEVLAEKNFAKENTKPTQILEAMDGYVLGQAQVTAYFNLYDDDQAAAAAKEEIKVLEETGSTGGTAGPAATPALAKKNGGADPKHTGAVAVAAGGSPASTTATTAVAATSEVTSTADATAAAVAAAAPGTASAGTFGTPPPPERKHLRR